MVTTVRQTDRVTGTPVEASLRDGLISPRLLMIQGLPMMGAETWYNVDYADYGPSPPALAIIRT